VRTAPADYELDLNGALAVKGEVLAIVSELELSNIEVAGFRVLRRTVAPELGIEIVILSRDGWALEKMLQRLRRIDPEGVFEPNHVFSESGSREPSSEASRSLAGSASATSGTKVGLIDTGVSNAVDSNRIRIYRRNFAPTESAGKAHGTAVAHLLSRKPGPVTIYAADIFGAGPRGGTAELLVQALAWMMRESVPVINISMVGPENRLVGTAIARILAKGHLVVAPVGNDGPSARPLFPASYAGVIAVSAVAADGKMLPESSRVSRVDVAGPGIAKVPDTDGRLTVVRGTSFAAPVISRMLADAMPNIHPAVAVQAKNAVLRLAIPARSNSRWYGQGWLSCDTVRSCDP
jgi:subtilisin family serine protease